MLKKHYNLKNRSIDLQGHRGARGKRPENTIPAFEYCMTHHMTTLELDTNVTRDKQLIIHHDTAVNGNICLDPTGKPARRIPIKNLTVKELKQLDCGAVRNTDFPEQVPVCGTRLVTLTDLFDFVREYEAVHEISPGILFNIETKFSKDYTAEDVREFVRLMVETIEEAGMDARSTVQSFVLEVLPEIRKLNSRIKTSALFRPDFFQKIMLRLGFSSSRNRIIQQAGIFGADIISPHYIYVNAKFVKRCHQKNMKILPWTANEATIIKKLLDYGVDGIISDYPDRLFRSYSSWASK